MKRVVWLYLPPKCLLICLLVFSSHGYTAASSAPPNLSSPRKILVPSAHSMHSGRLFRFWMARIWREKKKERKRRESVGWEKRECFNLSCPIHFWTARMCPLGHHVSQVTWYPSGTEKFLLLTRTIFTSHGGRHNPFLASPTRRLTKHNSRNIPKLKKNQRYWPHCKSDNHPLLISNARKKPNLSS